MPCHNIFSITQHVSQNSQYFQLLDTWVGKLLLIGLAVVQGKWHTVTSEDLGEVPGAGLCTGAGLCSEWGVARGLVIIPEWAGQLWLLFAADMEYWMLQEYENSSRNSCCWKQESHEFPGGRAGSLIHCIFQARYFIFKLPLKDTTYVVSFAYRSSSMRSHLMW